MGTRSCKIIIHNKIRYFLDAKEMSFVTHLIYLKDLRYCGCRTAYSQDFNFKSFQLNRAVFYRCTKRLESLKLLERKAIGRFTDYVFLEDNYNRLTEIVNATDNIYALISFSEKEFILKKRSIDQITDSEIEELKIREDSFK